MQKLTLEALEVLDAIDSKGSFAAAAAALYRVPSKITYTINKLEDDLGVSLFRKEGRRSVLTPTGKLLLEQGREILLAADRLVEQARLVESGWESRFNIALSTLYEASVLHPVLEEFYAIQPNIEINLYEEVLGGSWEALAYDRVDLSVGASEMPERMQGMITTKMRTLEWVYCASPDHPVFENSTVTEEQLKAYRAVVVRDSSRSMPHLSRRVFDNAAVLRVATMQQKIDAQRAGLGLGFLPRFRIQEYLKNGELIEINLPDPEPNSALYFAWKANNKGRALRWFVEKLSQKVMAGAL